MEEVCVLTSASLLRHTDAYCGLGMLQSGFLGCLFNVIRNKIHDLFLESPHASKWSPVKITVKLTLMNLYALFPLVLSVSSKPHFSSVLLCSMLLK